MNRSSWTDRNLNIIVRRDIVRQSLLCGENAMRNSDNNVVFNNKPKTVCYWLRSVIVKKIYCLCEEISIAHEDESDFIHTPFG